MKRRHHRTRDILTSRVPSARKHSFAAPRALASRQGLEEVERRFDFREFDHFIEPFGFGLRLQTAGNVADAQTHTIHHRFMQCSSPFHAADRRRTHARGRHHCRAACSPAAMAMITSPPCATVRPSIPASQWEGAAASSRWSTSTSDQARGRRTTCSDWTRPGSSSRPSGSMRAVAQTWLSLASVSPHNGSSAAGVH